jgi:hypothetical protein
MRCLLYSTTIIATLAAAVSSGSRSARATEPTHVSSHGYIHSSSYSPLHYWAPTLWRLKMRCIGQQMGMDAPDRHPAIPPRYHTTLYPLYSDCSPR